MKVLLICSGGMSTAFLIKEIQKAAVKRNLEFEADAIGANETDEYNGNIDIVLLAPQIRHKYDEIKKFADSIGKKIYQIPMDEYSPLGANKLLDNIEKKLKED